MQSRGALGPAPWRAGGARGYPLPASAFPGAPVTLSQSGSSQLTPWGREVLLGGRWAPGFAGRDGVQASPSRARPASVRPVYCALPGPAPLPAAGAPPPAAVCLRCAGGLPPPQPPPSLRGRGRGLCKAASSCGGLYEWGGGWACTGPGRGKSPPAIPPASPFEHGSLVATLLIAKTRLGGEGVCV